MLKLQLISLQDKGSTVLPEADAAHVGDNILLAVVMCFNMLQKKVFD